MKLRDIEGKLPSDPAPPRRPPPPPLAERKLLPQVPTGWREMQCPLTGAKEPRKVAKIDP
jgi:hypothetical protein